MKLGEAFRFDRVLQYSDKRGKNTLLRETDRTDLGMQQDNFAKH